MKPPAIPRSRPRARTQPRGPTSFWALALGSVGIVYGDIGTSPLYAFREAATAAAASGPVTREIVLGVLSMILWALILVVTVKYVLILLRADNNGEGGTLVLMALAFRAIGRRAPFVHDARHHRRRDVPRRQRHHAGDLGALRGRRPEAGVACVRSIRRCRSRSLILVALFAVQRRGTAKVAAFFGPVMVVWFFCVAAAGLLHISDDPGVFLAINPYYAVTFLASHGFIGLVTLGAVFLAVTGGEALYADLGHFGRKPIQIAWFGLVLPALVHQLFRSGRAAARATRRRSPIRSTGWCRRCCCCRWWSWRPARP